MQSPKPADKASLVVIQKSQRLLKALDREERVIVQFPISLGAGRDAIPAGKLKIANEVESPGFTYDPALIHGAKPHYVKTEVAPGPNNPVGIVWLGLSKPHYGIHGTPDPSKIGREVTNGCVHMTNWDARKLATLVAPGTIVECPRLDVIPAERQRAPWRWRSRCARRMRAARAMHLRTMKAPMRACCERIV